MSLFGVEINHQVNRLLVEAKQTLAKFKLFPNCRTLYRSFAQYDSNITGFVTPKQFEKVPKHLYSKAINSNGLFYKVYQLQVLEKAYGNGQGKIAWFLFLQHVRSPMNPTRTNLVANIYEELIAKLGNLNSQSLVSSFNVNSVDVYKTGKVSAQDIKGHFISLFAISETAITKEQFLSFYDDLSVNFPHDQQFLRVVSQHWNYHSEKGNKYSQELLRQKIKALRHKLIQKTNGTNDEFLMKKLFLELDENKNGYLSPAELDLLLKKLELPLPEDLITPLFQKLDKNKSGFIQYDQFKHFLFFDPSPI